MSEVVEYTVAELVDAGILDRPMDGNHGEIHPKTGDFLPTGIPFVMASDLRGGRVDLSDCAFIAEAQAKSLRKGFAKVGDVLLSHKATIGRTAIVQANDFPYIMLTPQVTYYRVKDVERLDNRYLRAYFDGREFQQILGAWADAGSTRAYLGITAQLKLPIKLPSIGMQRAIADIYAPLSEKIEINRQMNATLETLARAIFRDWFVDFGPTRAKMRSRQAYLSSELWSLFPDQLDESTGLPEGWKSSTLSSILTVLETGRRPKGGVAGIESGIPSIGAESVSGVGKFDYSKTKYVPTDFFTAMSKGHVQDGDVLIYKDGGKPGQLRPAVSYISKGFPFDRFCINEHVFRARSEIMAQAVLYCLLTTDEAFAQMKELATGVAQPGLNQVQLGRLSFAMPDNPAVLKAANYLLSNLIDACNTNAVESHTLAQTRDYLLPKLMSGEIAIRDAAKQIEEAA